MKLYRIFLPKNYNSGKPIESNKIGKIAQMIKDRFGAYSFNPFASPPIIQGVWTSKDGFTYEERMNLIELFVEDTIDNQKWLRAFKEMVRQELNQEEIFIIVQDAEIIL